MQDVIRPENQILHPNWTGNRLDGNDLGMLKLSRPVDQTIHPLDLASKGVEILDAFRLDGLRYDSMVFKNLRQLAVVPTNNCKEMRLGRTGGHVSDDTICGFIPGLEDASGKRNDEVQSHSHGFTIAQLCVNVINL